MIIKNNGWFTKSINMKRGVRQGCPISSLLFIIGAEILANKIRINKNIHGLQLGNMCNSNYNHEIKLMQYADDTILICTDETSLESALVEIHKFSQLAGPRLNKHKTEAIGTGTYKHRNIICGIEIKTNIKCLGINIGHDKDQCRKHNWDDKIDKIDNLLCQWKKRHLTLFGKITVIKSLALSKITYSVLNTHSPNYVVKQLNTLFYKFIWGKTERIKRNTLIGNILEGGGNMVDIESHFTSLKASWIKRIKDNTATWAIVGNSIIQNFGGNHLLIRINTLHEEFINNIPPFYKEVFKANSKINNLQHNKIQCTTTLLHQPIWCNTHIKHKNKTLYNRTWINNNIILVKDLRFKNGKLDETFIYNKIHNNPRLLMEIFLVKNALIKYKHLLSNFEYSSAVDDSHLTTSQFSTKVTYQMQIAHIFIKPNLRILESRQELQNITTEEANRSMINKIKYMTDKKIAEFNYKIINNTLTNRAYLSKWFKETNPQCSYCSTKEDIIHMLYDCHINNELWDIVSKVLNTRITMKRLILGHTSYNITYCISIIAYAIYKYWLITFNKNEIKGKHGLYLFMQAEINNYQKILKINKQHLEATYIEKITHEINKFIASHYDPG